MLSSSAANKTRLRVLDIWARSPVSFLREFSIFAQFGAAVVPSVIIDMMRSICCTTRWLVTASLIMSLGFVGLFPQMMASAKTGARVDVAQKPTKCCCGTDDGRCCGMGCCTARQAPPTKPNPCPNPTETRDGQGNPLALAAKTLLATGGKAVGSGFGWPVGQSHVSQAESTLQAKRVRIDA